jgi:hypothetical protein
MKINVKKVLFRGSVTLVFCIGLLISFVFNPSLLYSKETTYKNFTIYHEKALDCKLIMLIEKSFEQLKTQELYDNDIQLEICLHDGSLYPQLIERLMGPDVIRSFANKSVVQADMSEIENDRLSVSEWGESFKASQWFTHSFAHCLQFRRYGFFGSNPLARHEEWKWEGYAEYASGSSYDLNSWLKTYNEAGDASWIEMPDGFKTTRHHLKFLVMIKYCIEIKGMTYDQILESKALGETVFADLMTGPIDRR